MDNTRRERITVRFRPHERVAVEAAAERSRMHVAEFIRAMALSAARRSFREQEDREEIAVERESARSPC